MGAINEEMSKWYKGLALDQQRAYEQAYEEKSKTQFDMPVEGITTQQQAMQAQAQQQPDYAKRLGEVANDLAAARLNLSELKRILSTLVFQLRILDLDAIEDKETNTIPLKVPVKVIRWLIAELDKEEGGYGTSPERPDTSGTTEMRLPPTYTGTTYPGSYTKIYTSDNTS